MIQETVWLGSGLVGEHAEYEGYIIFLELNMHACKKP